MPQSRPKTLVWFWSTGGAGIRFAHRVAREIAAKHGQDNVHLHLHAENPWVQVAQKDGFKHIRLVEGAQGHRRWLNQLVELPLRFVRFYRDLAAIRPDVVVVPMNFGLAAPLSLALRWQGIPLIYVVHDAAPHPGEYLAKMLAVTQRRLLRNATALVTVSSHVAEVLRLGQPEVATKLIDVIPLNQHCQRQKADAAPPAHTPLRLLFLGRMLRYKGLDLLAAALTLVRNRKDWSLTVAGSGPDVDHVRATFSAFPQVDASTLRFLDEEEVDTLMASHDVLVCSYTEASQSGVVAEGNSHGVPSIVTRVGGLPEQVCHGAIGWVVEPNDHQALADMISHIIANPEERYAKATAALESTPAAPGSTGWARLVERVAVRSDSG